MSCNRCDDIHEAQRTGRCYHSCECNCHNTPFSETPANTWTFPNDLATGGQALQFQANLGDDLTGSTY